MPVFARRVVLPQSNGPLTGALYVPERAAGVVVAAHDSRGPCYSARAQELAVELTRWGVAVLLLGLETGVEEEAVLAGWGVEDVAQVERAARRLEETCAFLHTDAQTASMRLGILGTGTGAAGALVAAARRPPGLVAVACSGGRPWLAGEAVERVPVPSLLVVASEDPLALPETLRLSKRLPGETSLRLIPGASRGFPEAGAKEEALRICGEWFREHLSTVDRPRAFGWADERGRWI